MPAVAVISVNKSAQQTKRANMLEISDDDVENAAPPKVLKSTVIQSTRILNYLVTFFIVQPKTKAFVVPQVVAPPIELRNVTIAKEPMFDAAPQTDPRDKKNALLETALQSVESALEKMQSTTASASMQQPPPPPPPMMSYLP